MPKRITGSQLLEQLADDDPMVVFAAIHELRRRICARPKLAAQVIKALDDSRPAVRSAAASVLGSLRPSSDAAARALAKALEDDDDEVQYQAVIALGEMSPPCPRAVDGLIRLLDNPGLDQFAMHSLAEIGALARPGVPRLIESLRCGVYPSAIGHGRGDTLRPDQEVREDVARALGKIGRAARAAVPALLSLLIDDDRFADAQAEYDAHLAGCRRDGSEIKMDPPGNLRVSVALALWQIDEHEAAIPFLLAAMRDADDEVRYKALLAVRQIGPLVVASVPRLIEALSDSSRTVRGSAATTLAEFGVMAITGITSMIRLLGDDDESVRFEAAGALAELVPFSAAATPALVELVRNSGGHHGIYEAQSLWTIARHPEAIASLVRILRGSHFNNRPEAALVLGEIGRAARAALPELVAAAGDPSEDERVRSAAKWAVARIVLDPSPD